MKKINKYLLLLAAAVFTLTACESDKEREPSPAGNPDAIAFKQSSVSVEINPAKAALEYKLGVIRTNADAELTAPIAVIGDIDVIKVPATVSFAKGELETTLLLTFPTAEVDSTYSIALSIDSLHQSPYASGASECSFTVTIAAWEQASTQAIIFDGIVNVFYSTGNPGWYVDYLKKVNTDGSFDIRLLNPYTVLPDYRDGNVDDPIQDQFGLYKGFPSNYPEDVDSKGTYNMDIHVDASDSATFDTFDMGMAWSYGEFYGAHAASRGMGIYDKVANTITFKGGTVACAMAGYNDGGFYLGTEDLIIYLDAKAYQNDHLSISDYNDPSIEWVEVESVVNQFESTIFNFINEEQKLYKAVDQYPGNPKSPFINLYCLKDVYADGGNLAFYWDGEDGEIDIPTPQDTKIAFMKQELLIAEAAGAVATADVKGTKVKVFSFDLLIVSEQGNEVGEFIETFSLADEAIAFEKSDFTGNFTLSGSSPFNGSAISFPIEIKEEGENLIILGVEDADTIWASFDDNEKAMLIEPQLLSNTITYSGTDYPASFYTITAAGSPSDEAVIKFIKKLNGSTVMAGDTEAIGYLIKIGDLGWWDGLMDLALTETAAATAPAKVASSEVHVLNGNLHVHQPNVPSVENLKFQGKYRPHMKNDMKAF